MTAEEKKAYEASKAAVLKASPNIQTISNAGRVPDEPLGIYDGKLKGFPRFVTLGQADEDGQHKWGADMCKVHAFDRTFRVGTDFEEFSKTSLTMGADVKFEIFSYEKVLDNGEVQTRKGANLLL